MYYEYEVTCLFFNVGYSDYLKVVIMNNVAELNADGKAALYHIAEDLCYVSVMRNLLHVKLPMDKIFWTVEEFFEFVGSTTGDLEKLRIAERVKRTVSRVIGIGSDNRPRIDVNQDMKNMYLGIFHEGNAQEYFNIIK